MSNDNDGWGTVEVFEGNEESTQVAFEIEEEENEPVKVEEEVVEEQQEAVAEEPKNLKVLKLKALKKELDNQLDSVKNEKNKLMNCYVRMKN